ncbi:hypothetical protein PILCRDRAFT_822741 [Piloderma croceum F 1598]|uniref:Uncharacterized protein n=1 Tax=Piloderma croceum (strain F 1598) TaxID=765440 RepID=A0A0C3FJZ8_PILCF|nr:hypothetical protein PILCRDRAFT_822741 [Piloderma croceum F 1598]
MSHYFPSQDFPAAPIHRLPVELLSYIFTLSAHTSFVVDDDVAEPSPSDFPFDPANMLTTIAISTVSRYWRDVALSTPALWTDICVSTELPDDDDEESRQLRNTMKPNADRIATYLARSGNAPIDILISARDPDWDFSETEVSADPQPQCDYDYFEIPYVHPFLSTDMHTVLDLLMPHLRRWRSLTILTDTCSPMHAALNRLSDPNAGTLEGAPLLESIVLKRCNEYIGSSTDFLPRELKSTPEVPFAALLGRMGGDYLPQLRKLRLHGVHLNWTTLPPLLPTTDGGLRSLELSEHPYEVRPTLVDFRRILASCPALHKLVVSVSGPIWDQDDSMDGTSRSDESFPIALPHLKELILGYTDADDARQVLKNLEAPNVKSLTIADTTSATFSQSEDVGSLLVACGTNAWGGEATTTTVVHDWVPTGEVEVSAMSPLEASANKTSPSRFPRLEEVTLDRVEACSVTPFRTFFGALPTLNRLTLQHTSMHAMQALMPLGEECSAAPTSPTQCPCPKLQSVHIRGAALDFDLISNARSSRVKHGAFAFDPEITLDHCRTDDVVHMGFEGMDVRIKSSDPYQAGGIDFEDSAMDLDLGIATKDDPFVYSGSFNDSAFDSYYGPLISQF